jgi:hypothetical protein
MSADQKTASELSPAGRSHAGRYFDRILSAILIVMASAPPVK